MSKEIALIELNIFKGKTIDFILKELAKVCPNAKQDEGDVKHTALTLSREGMITKEAALKYCQTAPKPARKARTTESKIAPVIKKPSRKERKKVTSAKISPVKS